MLLQALPALFGGVYRCVREVTVCVLDQDLEEVGKTILEAGTLLLVEGFAAPPFRRATLDVEAGLSDSDLLCLCVAEEELAHGCQFVREG